MGIKDKAMFALYLAAKKRKANNRQSNDNSYDDYDRDGVDEYDE